MYNFLEHFKTITEHKLLVARGCFAVGLYYQGIVHDLSKYSPDEFLVGARYFQGDQSPNNAERDDKGYSSAWLHHKGRNKHHYEYWMDYNAKKVEGEVLLPAPMPDKYIVEMFMDRIAACKVYQGKDYTQEAPLRYYRQGRPELLMHEKTRALLEKLLVMLSERGEDETCRYIRREVLKNRR